MSYRANDGDLPETMFEPEPAKPNRIQTTRARILTTANEMAIPVTFDEIRRFAIILCGLQDDAEENR